MRKKRRIHEKLNFKGKKSLLTKLRGKKLITWKVGFFNSLVKVQWATVNIKIDTQCVHIGSLDGQIFNGHFGNLEFSIIFKLRLPFWVQY